jgi:hypothetical protein
MHRPALIGSGHLTNPVAGVDLDGGQAGKRQQQGVVDLGEQPAHQVDGRLVAQSEDDGRVEPARRLALGGERQAQYRHVPVSAAELGGESGVVLRGLGDELCRVAAGEAHAARTGDHDRLVADREHGRKTHAEPSDARVVALGGGAQRGQRLHSLFGERSTCVRRDQDGGLKQVAFAEGQPKPAGYARAGRGVSGVLRELHDQPVAVAAERVVLLGVGILAEPYGRGGPGREHALANRRHRRCEGIVHPASMSHRAPDG